MTSRRLLLVLGALLALGWPASLAAQQSPDQASLDLEERATVGPGDRVDLRIWREEGLSGEFQVDENGIVTLPQIGEVRVTGLTPGELRDSIGTAYREFLRNPSIEVSVLRRLGVHGEVRAPTLYWVDVTMSLRDVIARAGGMTPEGDPDEIWIVRGEDRVRYHEAESHTVAAGALRSGDQVVVGRRSWAYLNAPYLISTGISLMSILAGFLLAR